MNAITCKIAQHDPPPPPTASTADPLQRRPSTRGGVPSGEARADAVAAATPMAAEGAASDPTVTVDLEASVPGEHGSTWYMHLVFYLLLLLCSRVVASETFLCYQIQQCGRTNNTRIKTLMYRTVGANCVLRTAVEMVVKRCTGYFHRVEDVRRYCCCTGVGRIVLVFRCWCTGPWVLNVH